MTMKKIYMLLFFACLTGLSSCKKFIDVNEDPNRPTDVTESLILAPVEMAIASRLHAGYGSNLVLQYTQVMALNQPSPNLGTYLLYPVNMDEDWYVLYVQCLNNLVVLTKKAEANGNLHYAGIAKILTAYSLGTGTDLWGDIPFSEAFKGSENFRPVYDTQEQIYVQIQQLLDGGLADIASNVGKTPAGDDLFYGGDMQKWAKLAYTLKARYYMHLTKAPGHTATAQAQLALTALQQGMSSDADDFKMSYAGAAGTENPWQQNFLSASTIILSSTFVDGFKQRNDPRLPKMVAPGTATGLYTGRLIGEDGIGPLESYSRPAAFYGSAAADNFLVPYTEALFLKAEATYLVSGVSAAAPVYTDAVTTHMNKLGLSSSVSSAYLATRPLIAGTALKTIIEEKAVSNYLSMETFVDFRRTGYPALTKVRNALSEIPRRVLYPQSERISNPQAVQSAKLTDRVWWDAP
jgi:hypothetical protein